MKAVGIIMVIIGMLSLRTPLLALFFIYIGISVYKGNTRKSRKACRTPSYKATHKEPQKEPEINKVYQDLTGINIAKQREIWDERGRGYWGEFLVFSRLYDSVPGASKYLMNVRIPCSNGTKDTEIDLLLIHETGLYVFEIKHYKGAIYGKPEDREWTQAFRTTPNYKFRNPLSQNRYHVEALSAMWPGIPITSVVVFTHDNCELRVDWTDTSDTKLWRLNEMEQKITSQIISQPSKFSADQVNAAFLRMLPYAPVKEQSVSEDGKILQLSEYGAVLREKYKQLENYQKNESLRYQKNIRIRALSMSVAVILLMATISISGAVSVCKEANEQAKAALAEAEEARIDLEKMQRKFEKVEAYNGGDITISPHCMMVADVAVEESQVMENTTCLSFSLAWECDGYDVLLGKDAAIVVQLANGSVKEYSFWSPVNPYGSSFNYAQYYLNIGKGHKVKNMELYEVTPSEIEYIKIINIAICRKNQYPSVEIPVDYEVEVYRKEK